MSRAIVRLADIAAQTGIPVATLRYYRATGQGPRTWLLAGKVVAFQDDVDAWVQSRYESGERP